MRKQGKPPPRVEAWVQQPQVKDNGESAGKARVDQ